MSDPLDAELSALLAPMPEGGALEGEQLERFNELISRIGLEQARAARRAAQGNPALMKFEDEQIRFFEKRVAGPRQGELFAT